MVGWSYTSGTSTPHAFLYNSGGGMTDLNSLPIVARIGLDQPQLGDGRQQWYERSRVYYRRGDDRRSQPRIPLAITVPEPSTLLLASASLISLLIYAWRKRYLMYLSLTKAMAGRADLGPRPGSLAG